MFIVKILQMNHDAENKLYINLTAKAMLVILKREATLISRFRQLIFDGS